MARKPTAKETLSHEPALLGKPREEVRAQLLARITLGDELLARTVNNSAGLAEFKSEYSKWDEYNGELLRRAFTSSEYADQYNYYAGVGVMVLREKSLQELASEARERVVQKRNRLVSLIERLDLIEEDQSLSNVRQQLPPVQPRRPPSMANRKVFVVHGQDEEAKAIVARFISSCDLEPIILHEQANGGRTLIEKFERESDVGFAVIIMTPDDVGGRRREGELESDDLKARARQNVVLELGYFAGRLGRARVAALKKGDLELPSDIAGVVWTAIDTADGWKMSLARELKAAGFEFDLGKALSI